MRAARVHLVLCALSLPVLIVQQGHCGKIGEFFGITEKYFNKLQSVSQEKLENTCTRRAGSDCFSFSKSKEQALTLGNFWVTAEFFCARDGGKCRLNKESVEFDDKEIDNRMWDSMETKCRGVNGNCYKPKFELRGENVMAEPVLVKYRCKDWSTTLTGDGGYKYRSEQCIVDEGTVRVKILKPETAAATETAQQS